MIKVFLIEDESVIREGLRDNIPWEQYGYKFVGEAADGEIALPLIRKTKPDVLITDIKMPFMDGLSLSRIISEEFPKTKIIIISGYDDFEYARQAIEVGVEQYLLKPITKHMMKKTLLELKEKIEQDLEQSDYQTMFQNEMQEYEQFARRHFFEKVLEGKFSVKEIYDEASKLSLELTASSFNLLFFYLQEKGTSPSRNQLEDFSRKQEEICHFFLRYPQYILFGWNANCYGVLIKSEQAQMQEVTERSVAQIKSICTTAGEEPEWYVAVGNPVERLSMLPNCYQGVNHFFAYRFIVPSLHIFTEQSLSNYLMTQEEANIENVDPSKMDQEVIKDFLARGSSSEIHDFVETYLKSISEALKSRMFRDYVILNIRFTITASVNSLGISKEEYQEALQSSGQDLNMKPEEVFLYFADMLQAAISFRDKESDNQGRKVLRRALDFIDENYCSEALSLNMVAEEVNVSSNYLSAVFSQNMQKTLIEYITGKRMDKAKKLLKGTDDSSSAIGLAVGYKDPHYFSFVFKKTQGCSPREYRSGKKPQ